MSHTAPDLEALEKALHDRLMTLTNTLVTPSEPLLRDCFNLLDEAMSDDERIIARPAVGILHDGEPWQPNELLGGHASQAGSERWKLIVLCDSPAQDGGVRGGRGAYSISKQVIEGIEDPDDAWQIASGCPIEVVSRNRYQVRDENGELLPVAGYVVEIQHPVYFE